jgi:hypothetical protein
VSTSSADFSFSATEDGSTFECSLDGSAFEPCSSPQSYTHLSEGSHSLEVKATDQGGNTDPTPASLIWTVDTTTPETTIASGPADGATLSSGDASFTFSSNEAGSTLECSLDSAAYTGCTSPKEYTDLSEGSHTFSVRATDAAGNTDASPASTTWTVDTTAPETKIDSNPYALTKGPSASFDFSSTEPGSSFQCKLDSGTYESCTSPMILTGLSDGSHTFAVKATDAAGNTDASPDSYTWTVDTVAPNTTIDSNPNALTNTTSANFSFSSNEANSTFQCKLDGGAYASCTSPKSLSGLSDGSHTFSVRATDAAGNIDPTPADFTWTVDTTPPDTSITGSPAEGSTDTDGTVSFDFASTEANSTFRCQMDLGGYASCSSPQDYTGLASGSHTFSVKATDPAGNTDSTPATRNFSVQVPTQPYPGLRFTKTVGVAVHASKNMTAQDVQNLYATYMKPAYHGADDSVDFVVQTKLNWPDVMDNPSVKPTLTNMRNPNWSGYTWDTLGSDAAEIDKMLQAPCVVNGKCKISINIGTGATGGTNPPDFMLSNGLAWEGEGSGTYIRVKWYKQEARQYAEAFTSAAIERFDDPGISSIKLNEYYPGGVKPADWDSSGGQTAYEEGYETYLRGVLATVPTDSSGDRVVIYQTNPLRGANAFTQADVEEMKLGIAGSDPYMFSDESPDYSIRHNLHGVVPMSAPLDAPRFNRGYTVKYDGTPNPWGYTNGQNIAVGTDQVAWYHGHCGPLPMDEEFITKPGLPTNGFIDAMDQFGPGGDDHSNNCSVAGDDWGGVPFDY